MRRAEREKAQIEEQLGQIGEAMEVPDIRGIFKRQLLNLNDSLKNDPVVARTAMGDIFGRIALETRGDQLWGQIETSPALLLASGDTSNAGSGGRI